MNSVSIFDLEQLAGIGDWSGLLDKLENVDNSGDADDQIAYYRALSLYRTGRRDEALAVLAPEAGSTHDRSPVLELKLKLLLVHGQFDIATQLFAQANKMDVNANSVKASLAEMALQEGLWAQAVKINEMLPAFSSPLRNADYCVIVQCFIKSDTLGPMLDSICKCNNVGEFDLLIVQDSYKESRFFKDSQPWWEETWKVIELWLPRLRRAFKSVEVVRNNENLGTTSTCVRAINRTANSYKGFLFFEDDCILAPNALNWLRYGVEKVVDGYDILFVGAESTIFDTQGVELSAEQLEHLTKLSEDPKLRNKYIKIQYVPSTCFATRSSIWKEVAQFRSFPMGAGALNSFVRNLNKHTAVPVIGYVKDVGMLHERGYSIAVLGRDGVREVKTVMLLDEGADFAATEFDGKADELKAELNGILFGLKSENAP